MESKKPSWLCHLKYNIPRVESGRAMRLPLAHRDIEAMEVGNFKRLIRSSRVVVVKMESKKPSWLCHLKYNIPRVESGRAMRLPLAHKDIEAMEVGNFKRLIRSSRVVVVKMESKKPSWLCHLKYNIPRVESGRAMRLPLAHRDIEAMEVGNFKRLIRSSRVVVVKMESKKPSWLCHLKYNIPRVESGRAMRLPLAHRDIEAMEVGNFKRLIRISRVVVLKMESKKPSWLCHLKYNIPRLVRVSFMVLPISAMASVSLPCITFLGSCMLFSHASLLLGGQAVGGGFMPVTDPCRVYIFNTAVDGSAPSGLSD
ncbi:hypothetical protein QYF36_006870 [Acer negundo]|nr:hypothetical protein QYF36_006870 [Acer negundo]